MRTIHTALLAAAVTLVGGVSAASVGTTPPTTADPADFDRPLANAYFPLVPGTLATYRGTDEGRHFRERVVVTARTKVIQGVTTTVVRDVVRRADGTLSERTEDWYAADDAGNVWYFGEDTATYDGRGHVASREGSWQAGVDGAVAGIIMPADPAPTDAYRQEYLRDEAEDQAWVVERGVTTRVPYGAVHDVVRTFEWSRLEKGVVSVKLYAPGLGIVREQDLTGGDEVFELVSVRHR
ncbi:hypothetical protein J2X46_003313 [Nocardioides sp. BE266]|uniref:hypothetical protein n=1 Tax=Nocardioides sp. BE266 TaxID=2817725 RepID=UPI0028642077|nr:hypothetical protein [Nocardioides sp. BE266]MDR7254320.1 hypothetical protein [Nocardioides sp. BE266]